MGDLSQRWNWRPLEWAQLRAHSMRIGRGRHLSLLLPLPPRKFWSLRVNPN